MLSFSGFGISLFVLIFVIAVPILSARFQFKPLREAARQKRLPLQFALTDIFILLGMFGVSGSIFSTMPEELGRLFLMVVAWLCLLVSWIYAVVLLSRSGVQSSARRLVIEALAPIATFGILMFLAVLVGVSFSSSKIIASDGHVIEEAKMYVFWRTYSVTPEFVDKAGKVFLGLSVVAIILWFIVPRKLSRWALSNQGYVPPQKTSELPQTPHDAPLLDPHVKDLKLK